MPGIEPGEVGVAEVLGVLGALVLLGEEGALEEDALDAGALAAMGGLGDARAGAAGLLEGGGQRGGQPARGSTTRELARDRAHAVRVAVHHIVAGETVDVGIDETGGDDGIAQIENLDTLGSLVTPCTEASILDGQVPALCETVGQHESPCFDGICAHGSSPSTNPIDSDCTYQPVSLRGQLPPHRKPADVSQERIPAQIEAMAYTDKQDTPCFMQLFAQSYRPMGAI